MRDEKSLQLLGKVQIAVIGVAYCGGLMGVGKWRCGKICPRVGDGSNVLFGINGSNQKIHSECVTRVPGS